MRRTSPQRSGHFTSFSMQEFELVHQPLNSSVPPPTPGNLLDVSHPNITAFNRGATRWIALTLTLQRLKIRPKGRARHTFWLAGTAVRIRGVAVPETIFWPRTKFGGFGKRLKFPTKVANDFPPARWTSRLLVSGFALTHFLNVQAASGVSPPPLSPKGGS